MSDTSAQYEHKQEAVQRPDVGVQDQFSIKKPNRVYRYDSSLDPALSWDENRERELGEWLIGLVARCADEGEDAVFQSPQVWKGGGIRVQSLKAAAGLLQTISQPFLNWSGKAERHQLSVPTTPLFVHERHSTKAILDGIKSRKAKGTNLDLFGDAQLDVTDRLDAYEHKGPWQNRMILGDSLQVMNSMLEFEGLGGQVQMVFIDPPYGVKFGSNFQPFVRKRDVKHGPDSEMTREPEMVKAYRDTWELGLHSYLTYLRDRLLMTRELLHESGSVFVQISEENVHHVRSIMDEVFGAQNFISLITFRKKLMPLGAKTLESMADFLVWYAKDATRVKYRQLFRKTTPDPKGRWTGVCTPDGTLRRLNSEERADFANIPNDCRIFGTVSQWAPSFSAANVYPLEFEGKTYEPTRGQCWVTSKEKMEKLGQAGRLFVEGDYPRYVVFHDDFPFAKVTSPWDDTAPAQSKTYVVQTNQDVIARCMHMTTDPGDLVLDPTCGSGTTAYVAEQWGRRWITCDTSRVPLALARQRLLTATFPYYDLKEPKLGPAGGFVYARKKNRKGEEVGGLVPRISLKSIANDEPPTTEVMVDRPEKLEGVTRVSGPFVVEATIAPAQTVTALGNTPAGFGDDSESTAIESSAAQSDVATHIERMTQVLRQSKTLRLPGNRELVLEQIRRASDGDILHAEASDAEGKRIAIVFGPESGAISADMVFEAAREAHFLRFDQLYFFAFAIQAKARELIEERNKDGSPKLRIHCTYVSVTPDVAMSDLLKTTRASEIFSVTGLPDVKLTKLSQVNSAGDALYQVDVKGLDIFNPASMDQESVEGENLPCWMLDTDYDPSGSFYATQVFFPKTSAWDNLQKSLKTTFDASVWSHLSGTTSEPFVLGQRRRIAVKVIDERGNELMRVVENIA
ncbi:site-specific DNA-methyltransferase [Burkholderia cepacia]|uniref:site-specific DNA-methyltransferase (adenine-specific) n=1 Tax=Burkholderia cepacia TaxID=292 RepID=A0ABM6NR17_BURCE|nr:site-specific DNA-methyltransferase [Burkholderia cepacia]AIO24914.1 DNA methylase family protein [Burkholderia cepacia ATCC 25416]ALK16979.1 DNA methylase [Burkholderia cepacia ATCC 25416]ASE94399.1 site-specific DNA-methyltransferase [Burkholderia cepacia]ATF77426.1 site-specific DNA-methyltransferase [Burkholderia cepacia]MCA8470397.1 site-specific DNA-methyltransferase [Burkholderia cepacia]